MGSSVLYADKGAILMKINDTTVASKYYAMMDEAVFASPGMVILHTSQPSQDWANAMTATANDSPLAAILKLSYRSSNRGGRPFAKAQLLDSTISAKKAEAASAKTSRAEQERRKLFATVSIQSLEAAGREEIAGKIMEAIQGATNSTFIQKTATGDLKKGEWKLVKTLEGKWAGRIHFQAEDTAAIQAVFTKLHGAAVEADGNSHTIEVLSDFIRNPKLAGR